MDIPWSRPKIGRREKDAAIEVVESEWLTQGEEVAAFESELGSYTGQSAAVVSNGTTALISALLAHDVGDGDEVLVPTYTFVATVNAVLTVGATPVLVNANLDTFNVDVEDLKAKASPETAAILPVDVAGMPVDLDAITDIARDVDAVVIEDAAEAIGAEYRGDRVGSHGHTTVFSFHMAKLAAAVEGGAVIGSEEICSAVREIRNHGMTERYRSQRFGLNFRMTDIQAAIGRAQFAQLPTFLNHRSDLASLYRSRLDDAVTAQTVPEYVTRHPYMLFMVCFESAATRDDVREALTEAGVGTRVCWRPVHRQPYYERDHGNLATADDLFARSLALPIGNDNTRAEVETVCDVVNRTL